MHERRDVQLTPAPYEEKQKQYSAPWSRSMFHKHFSMLNNIKVVPNDASSIMPRTQLKSMKNKIKPLLQHNLVTQSPKGVTLSFRHTEPCREHHVSCRCSTKQTALCPNAMSGSLTPCMTDWSVSPLSLRTASWSECTNTEWVLRTLGRGYRLQFAVMPPQFRGVIQSEALGEAIHILQGRFLPC